RRPGPAMRSPQRTSQTTPTRPSGSVTSWCGGPGSVSCRAGSAPLPRTGGRPPGGASAPASTGLADALPVVGGGAPVLRGEADADPAGPRSAEGSAELRPEVADRHRDVARRVVAHDRAFDADVAVGRRLGLDRERGTTSRLDEPVLQGAGQRP